MTELEDYDGMDYDELAIHAKFLHMENAELRELVGSLWSTVEWMDGMGAARRRKLLERMRALGVGPYG